MMMSDVILVLNSGSSSIKFTLFKGERELLDGQISGLGAEPHLEFRAEETGTRINRPLTAEEGRTHQSVLSVLLPVLEEQSHGQKIDAVGHRVVHGGSVYSTPLQITDEVLANLRSLEPLAPLHQPHNLAGVDAARTAFPNAIQTACFDTAFHRNHPWVNDTFALPRPLYEEGVRRYGFHGLSYEFICSYLKSTAPNIHSG
jgi:acetate kinase